MRSIQVSGRVPGRASEVLGRPLPQGRFGQADPKNINNINAKNGTFG
jgi:hypothetical protein